jgi:hypothetical protein
MDIDLIWVSGEGKYFCKRDWTGRSRLIRFNKLGFPSHRSGSMAREHTAPECRFGLTESDATSRRWRDFRPDGVNIALIRANR